ncbi:enoyl-CoA hydratase [Aeromicrobium sp. PE09-221]|uniref:DUF3000 domain-containing protein n=1 Tax=Aeromicrobium sp. PE09-221 TaxID=1898043 RepID=UPI000B3EAC4D|nr:DUF3000 domain-containing protein [Aeromicrobium sp. PE09-221]OUZ09668.1 enoyl-CoA hydratase [Aeromicrobium sp. PE09-221]
MAARTDVDGTPAAFTRAVEQIMRVDARPELTIHVMPPPQRIAPYAHAISGDLAVAGEDVATGRFICLYDPAGHEAWEGSFRCVTFAKADIEPEMASDPVLTEVGWSWLTDALDAEGAGYHAASGSVTVVRTDSFGQMAEDGSSAQVEVRASWSPDTDTDTGCHAQAWMHLLAELAGLPPLTPGVIPLRRTAHDRRGSHG